MHGAPSRIRRDNPATRQVPPTWKEHSCLFNSSQTSRAHSAYFDLCLIFRRLRFRRLMRFFFHCYTSFIIKTSVPAAQEKNQPCATREHQTPHHRPNTLTPRPQEAKLQTFPLTTTLQPVPTCRNERGEGVDARTLALMVHERESKWRCKLASEREPVCLRRGHMKGKAAPPQLDPKP